MFELFHGFIQQPIYHSTLYIQIKQLDFLLIMIHNYLKFEFKMIFIILNDCRKSADCLCSLYALRYERLLTNNDISRDAHWCSLQILVASFLGIPSEFVFLSSFA